MSDEVNHLQTARADRPLWMIKCPTVVSRAWQEAAASAASDAGGANPNASPNHNPVVAKVVVSFDPLRSEDKSLQFKMEMAQKENGNTPKSYSLNMFKDFVPMSIFSESNQGKLALEGKVEYKFDMKPHRENLLDYRKLCRERTEKANNKSRQVQVLLDDTGKGMRPMPVSRVSIGTKDKKSIPVRSSDMKRTRMDPTELVNILFKLFERKPNWSLKQLMHETDQPEQFLKETLNTICDYNKRGPNLGTHELKPEYRKSTENT